MISPDDINELTHLGSEETFYEYAGANPRLLETFLNQFPERMYSVVYETEEFTSLCPKTGQPDFAKITITYSPKDLCVETKSLKLYLGSYRQHQSFMETITNNILTDLVNICNPHFMSVVAHFRARGGTTVQVDAHYYSYGPNRTMDPAYVVPQRAL